MRQGLPVVKSLGWPGTASDSPAGLGWPAELGPWPSTPQIWSGTEHSEPSAAGDAGAPLAVSSAQTNSVSRETLAAPAVATAAAVAEVEPLVVALSQGTPLADSTERRLLGLARIRGRTLARPAETRVLAVVNQKGGVGKTTSTVNLAAALAQLGMRVLVVDLDPQGNASTALSIAHAEGTAGSYHVLVGGTAVDDVVAECEAVPGLFVVPATIDLAGAEIELVPLVARETRLKRALDAHLQECAEVHHRYDYVFIDCPPSLGLLTVNALAAGRELLIPIQCEYYALEGVSALLRTIESIREHLNPALTIGAILLTMYDGRTRLAAGVAEEVRRHFGDVVLETVVPRSVRISEAPSHGQTVITYDPSSAGTLCYFEAAGELAQQRRDSL